jgi:hypothetical protein
MVFFFGEGRKRRKGKGRFPSLPPSKEKKVAFTNTLKKRAKKQAFETLPLKNGIK